MNTSKMFLGLVILMVLLCFSWIFFYDSAPVNDQDTLFKEAQKIAGYNNTPYNATYMIAFKRQRFVVLLMSLGIKLTGNNYLGFKLFNVIGAVGIYFGIHNIIKKREKNFSFLAMFFTFLFYPIIIYTSFLYGTLLSFAFSIWGFYNAIEWVSKRSVRNALLMSFCFTIAISFHQSAAIAFLAACIYLIVNINKKNVINILFIIVISFLLIFAFGKIVDYTYERITNIEKGDSLPPLATIAMGLTSTDEYGGPGSQDGSFFQIYDENNRISAETNKASLKIIKNSFLDFISGKRSLSFFYKKIQYQWLDPTLGSKKTIITNYEEPYNSKLFLAFYNSSLRNIIFKFSNVFMIVIYGFSFITGIMLTINDKSMDDSSANIHLLFQLYVIGGFIFQLFWESLSRYCFPYYLFIIIEGSYGITILNNKVKEAS
ncbi:MAG: hypothetical protein MJZ11_06980 [Lachnospiraceae bacterium]|nr:hypothetical protein [Lachnospiraceae bacterium]